MLAFAVYTNGRPAESVNLSGAYLLGSDDVPLRAEITFKSGVIHCSKRATGPAGLAILWDIPGVGTVLTETVRLQERKTPYLLQVELARGRLLRINQKVEDWGLLDFDGVGPILEMIAQARDLLINALQDENPARAARIGNEALGRAGVAAEALARFHAEVLLARRKQAGGLPRRTIGCGAPPERPSDTIRQRMTSAVDYVTLSFAWKDIEPSEQTFNWKQLDAWVEMLTKHRIPIRGSSLLSFSEYSVPDWLFIWEHDFDTMRDLAFEHIRRVINRYGPYIQFWDVITGIHACNCFTFNFEQLMELTRMAAALTKQTLPRSTVVVDLVAPWGEYYGRNQRTIPPLLYADMVLQSGVNLDAFGLRFLFGPAVDGMFVRDLFQISAMLDLYAKLSKPLHISAVQVPSSASAGAEGQPPNDGGIWHEPWSESVQAEWLRQFIQLALSKPFVESVNWHSLTDCPGQPVANGGLLRADLAPKGAFHELVKIHSELVAPARRGERQGAAS